jgi:hypothetical protein
VRSSCWLCRWWKIDFDVIMGGLVDTAAWCFDSTTASSGESHEESNKEGGVERSADMDMNIPSLGRKMAQ